MFRANRQHLQTALISAVSELPEKQRQRLEASWAGIFRRELFSRLNEAAFAVLYSDAPSRPNVPVNVLLGLESLKAGYGWSDEELYDHFLYDLQVRYAVGYESLGQGDFELRTLYNFRRRLSQYNLAHGTNLLAQAFADITDQQITDLAVRTGQQRMDSTQVASNIVLMSRLQLVVEALQRLVRLLADADRLRYEALVAPYVGERAGHFVHRIKGLPSQADQLQAVGVVLHQLLHAMAADYEQAPAYQAVARLFSEQFRVAAAGVAAKANQEIAASSLQSLDDLEASYREKQGVGYRGYVVNVSETCDPANALQLITHVATAPNTTQDSQLLAESLPELQQRTGLTQLYTDGAYAGPTSDPVLADYQVELLQTGILGPQPKGEHLHLRDFEITPDAQGEPTALTCPRGQAIPVTPSPRGQCYNARFDAPACAACPLLLAGHCPPHAWHGERRHLFRFTRADMDKARRHRRSRALRAAQRNLRAAVEATVRSLKHPFPAGKLPVRGLFRVTCLMISAAAMTNVRRIHRYRLAQAPPPDTPAKGRAASGRRRGGRRRPGRTARATAAQGVGLPASWPTRIAWGGQCVPALRPNASPAT